MKREKYMPKRHAKQMLAVTLATTMCVPAGIPLVSMTAFGQTMEHSDQQEESDFEELRLKWKTLLTGGEALDNTGKLGEDYIASVNKAAQVQWDSMNKLGDATEDTRTCIFPDIPMTDKSTKTGSSQITLTFDRLKAIALAYETSESDYYQKEDVKKEIVAALDMMIANHYSLSYACSGTGTGHGSGNHSFDNWYDWRIGTPRQLCELLLMLSDELTTEQIDRYTAPILANNKQVDTTGANRTWIASIFIQTGILRGDGSLILAGKNGLKDVFKYVEVGDGFHADGSFIQHSYYAYTGGYGKALLCTMAPLMYILNGTEYAIAYDDNCEQIFYDMIFEAYEPLIYGGRFMDMAREREISRVANQDSIPGRQAIRSIIMLLDVLPEEQKERGISMVKEWLSDDEVLSQVCIDPIGGYNEYYLPAGVIQMAEDIVNSDAAQRGSLVKHKRFGAMDRVVHLRDKFGFTASMSSKRICNTEGTNDEGLRLWHIGDGLTYLYNTDKNYYSDHYWATVDYQRLPGTTVNRIENRAKKEGFKTANPYNFAGGTDLGGEYGIAGMELQGVGSSGRNGAHSRKSWFMFDDEVVAVGSDIRSTLDGSEVDTTVENRKIALDKSNVLTVNGVVQNAEDGGEPYEKSNKSLKVTSVTAASDRSVEARLPLAARENGTKKATFSCRVKMPATEDFFALKLYGTSNNSEKNLVFLTMRNGSMVPRMTGGKDAYSADAALKADKWHDIKAELDLEKQTFNYYVDGKQIKNGVSINKNTVNADLVDAGFFAGFNDTELGSEGITLSAFEIMAPGSKAGSIQVDDLSIEADGVSLINTDFEEANTGAPAGWTVNNKDNGAGSGAEVILEKVQIIPEGRDDFNGVHKDTRWIHLAGDTEDSDVGYYFPGGADITGVRETRKGSWKLVNEYEKFTDDEPRMNSFVTFWFDHGVKPADEKYSYVVLPGKNAEETEAYNENPDVEILCQTDSIHAVKEHKLNITGINFFEPGKYQSFRVEKPMSVMIQKQEDNMAEISFADPTQTLTTMKLEVSLPIEEVLEMDEGVFAENVDGVTVFTVATDTSARELAGRSFHIKVRLSEYDNTFESDEVGTLPEHWSVENGTGAVEKEENENQVLDVKAEGAGFAKAATAVDCQEEEGNMLNFQLKPVSGKGSVWLGNEDSQIEILSYGSEEDDLLTSGEWHTVKVKINAEKKTIQVMVDGKAYGEIKTFEYVPTDFSITTDGEIQLDNLLVRPISVQAPDTPKRLTFTSYSDSYVDLQWAAVKGDSPVHYTIMVNGEILEETVKENTYRVSGLEPGQQYTFQVRCEDDDDNISEWSKELQVTLLETQDDRYVIDFNDYEPGTSSQNRWTYGGADTKGKIEIVEAPEGNDYSVPENMITDLRYWKRSSSTGEDSAETASPSNATKAQKATASDAEKKITGAVKTTTKTATASNAEKKTEDSVEKVATATASDAEREVYATASSSNAERNPEKTDKSYALYVYSGTSGLDKTVSYPIDKQTRKQVYELDVYFDTGAPYTNFTLIGSNEKQAVTMMLSDDGVVGYRAGDDPMKTVKLLPGRADKEWIHFEIEADPQTQTFSIAANGEKRENLPFRYYTGDISKLTINAPKNGTGGIYVDNIILPGDEEYGKWIITALNDEFEEMEVPFGTPFDDLDLPEYVSVAVTDPDEVESDIEVRVNWDADDYDAEQSGKYTIHGTLALPSNYISKISDKDLKIKVNVEKKIPLYTLSLVQNAGGTIYSDVETAEKGTFVTVTAEPDDGYKLAAWIINGERKTASGNDYTFELNENMEIGAEFEAEAVAPEYKYYKVQLPDKTTGGKIEASSSYAKEGTTITLTVTPDEGYKLSVLKVNGKKAEPDEDGQYTFVLSRNTTVSVAFEKISDNSDSGTNNGNSGSHSSGSGSSGGKSSRVYNSTAPEAKYAVAGTWKQDGDNWNFTKTSGEMVKEQWACILWNNTYNWYYFDQNGMMKTGWIEINGQTFYLQPQSNGHRGEMLTGWQQIDGKWYWFQTESNGNKGALLKNGVTPDGYKVGADGSWVRN